MNNIVLTEVQNFLHKRKHQVRYSNHLRLNELFANSLEEVDTNVQSEVQTQIKNNQWEEQNPKSFRESLSKSKHPMMLTDYTESELSMMKLFKLKGFNIGYALKNHDGRYSEIVAVHNNEPNVRGIGELLMQSAVDNGGCYLDHFDVQPLNQIYPKLGFTEYQREPYNPEYDANGSFSAMYGKPDVVYRKHRNC